MMKNYSEIFTIPLLLIFKDGAKESSLVLIILTKLTDYVNEF